MKRAELLLAAAFMTGLIAGLTGLTTAARAQIVDSRLELGGRTLSLSGIEQVRLGELAQQLHGNPEAQDRALAEARAAAGSADARYAFATYELEIGRQRRDDSLRSEALDILIASRDTPSERLAGFLGQRGDIAFRAHQYEAASVLWTRLAELRPNDPQALMNLAQVRRALHDEAGAARLVERAIALQGSGAAPRPESWYRQWVSIAYDSHAADRTAAAAQALVRAYPSQANWRFVLVAYRQAAAPRELGEIDTLQLMRAVGAFERPAEYQRLAQLVEHSGSPREARAILAEGVARHVLTPTESPTREIIAEVDRRIANRSDSPALALLPDPAAESLHRGASLAANGRLSEAEAAFQLAAGSGGEGTGLYQNLARFWLAWLARPATTDQAAATR